MGRWLLVAVAVDDYGGMVREGKFVQGKAGNKNAGVEWLGQRYHVDHWRRLHWQISDPILT